MTTPYKKRIIQSNGDEALLFRTAKSNNPVNTNNPYSVELVRAIIDGNSGVDKDVITDLIGIKYESIGAVIDALTEAKAAIEIAITAERFSLADISKKKYLLYSDLQPAPKSPLKIL